MLSKVSVIFAEGLDPVRGRRGVWCGWSIYRARFLKISFRSWSELGGCAVRRRGVIHFRDG